MTIAYNSAYVQTETLNFTFAGQAIIVYFDAKRFSINVGHDTFLLNPHFNLEPDYISSERQWT